MKTALRKATEIVAVTADLYRELALSALSLLTPRHQDDAGRDERRTPQ